MTNIKQENPVNDVIRTLKAEMANPEVWEKMMTWGETHEAVMKSRAEKAWNHYMFDLTMAAIPGTAKRNEDGAWLSGYQFTVHHEYLDEKETHLGQLSDTVFLAFNTDGEIAQLIPWTEVSEFTTLEKPD
jgi:hypothetical protein